MDINKIADEVISIPSLTNAKYIVTKVAPPKNQTASDAIMATMLLVSYEDNDGKIVDRIKVNKDDNDIKVEFPHDKRGLRAMVYSGKYGFKFTKKVEGKIRWFAVGQDKYEESYFVAKVLPTLPDYSEDMSDDLINELYEEYLGDLFMAKLQTVFLVDKPIKPGIVTQFYRKYTPPKDKDSDDPKLKYGNTNVSKFSGRDSDLPNLTGEFKDLGEDVANAVEEAYESERFNAEDFVI